MGSVSSLRRALALFDLDGVASGHPYHAYVSVLGVGCML